MNRQRSHFHAQAMLLLLVLALFGSCTSEPIIYPPIGEPIFDSYRINRAWAFQCTGSYIDGSGSIVAYNCGQPDSSVPEVSGPQWSLKAVENRFHMYDSIVGHLDSVRILECYQLLWKSEQEPLSERIHRGYDMGSFVFMGFLYDTLKGERRDVLISARGDWEQNREGPATRELLSLLGRAQHDSLKQ